MDKQKKFRIIGGAVAVAAIGGWFMLSSIASSRAEEQLTQALEQYDLRDAVQWRNVSASPFGTVKIDEVSIRPGGERDSGRVNIKRVTISDFENTSDRKRAAVTVEDMADERGVSPLAATDFIRAAGRTDLQPLSMEIHWDFRRDDDEGALKAALKQPDAFAGDIELELDRVAGLMAFLEDLSSGKPDRYAGIFGFGLMGAVMERLGDVEIRNARGNVKDDGYVARSIVLFKRHSLPVSPDGGSIGRQRDKAFKDVVGEAADTCKRNPQRMGGLTAKRAECEALVEFTTGDAKTLSISMKPARPVSVGKLFQEGLRRPERAFQLLEPEIDN